LDQDAFRDTYAAVNERRCPYEKAVLTGNCACSLAKRFCIAEREGVRCATDEGQTRCMDFLERLRAQARFALKTTDGGSALPHAKAMRVQVGGLRGIHAAVQPEENVPERIDDIDATVEAAVRRFGSLDALPFQTIVQQITAFRGRRPLRERR